MATPHRDKPELDAPPDETHPPADRPEDWGWHGEWGRAAHVGGWVVVVILVLMVTATHYNHSGTFWLLAAAAVLVIMLCWDMYRRRNSWRR